MDKPQIEPGTIPENIAAMLDAWDERKRTFEDLRNRAFLPGEYEAKIQAYKTAAANFDKARSAVLK